MLNRIKKYWEFFLLPFVWVISPAFLVVTLKLAGINDWIAFPITGILGTLELLFWYHSTGKISAVVPAIASGQDRLRNSKVFSLIKRGGFPLFFFLALIPEPGSRIAGAGLCRLFDSKKGFLFLCFGNIFHIAFLIGGFGFIVNKFDLINNRMFSFVFAAAVFLTIIISTLKMTHRPKNSR